MIREEKIEFTAKWCKYSKYIIEKKDDKYYILPDKNANPSIYDPFEVKNQILKDLLVIGKESTENEMSKIGNKDVSIEAQSKMEKFQNLVFEFVSNYGLLGNFRYLPENYEFMNNGDIPVNLGNNTSISALEFEKKYFWKDSKMDWSSTMKANDYHRNTGFNDDFEQIEGDRINEKYKITDKSLSSHVLRHTRITRWKKAGVDMKVIQYWAGHVEGSNITDEVYVSLTEDFIEQEYKK